LANGREIRRFRGETEPSMHAAFTPDGRRMVATTAGYLIRTWEVASSLPAGGFRGHWGKVDSLAISPDGRRLVSGSWHDQTPRLWDLPSGRALGSIRLSTGPLPQGVHAGWSSRGLAGDGRHGATLCTAQSSGMSGFPIAGGPENTAVGDSAQPATAWGRNRCLSDDSGTPARRVHPGRRRIETEKPGWQSGACLRRLSLTCGANRAIDGILIPISRRR
jgi:hypothetical protein